MNFNCIVEALRAVADIDPSKAPAIVLMGKIRKSLIKAGFSSEMAEELAGSISIDLPIDLEIDDEQFNEASYLTAKTLKNIEDALRDQGFKNASGVLVKYAAKFKIHIN